MKISVELPFNGSTTFVYKKQNRTIQSNDHKLTISHAIQHGFISTIETAERQNHITAMAKNHENRIGRGR